jgi:hypothetical protein
MTEQRFVVAIKEPATIVDHYLVVNPDNRSQALVRARVQNSLRVYREAGSSARNLG